MVKDLQRALSALLSLSFLVAAVGCGPPDYYKCSGVVTHDGRPVPFLQITFKPDILDSTRPPMAIADKDGKFEMKCGREIGVPPGTYTVLIEDPAAADGGKTSTEADYLYVVDRYSPQKSSLKYESDAHRADYELKLDTSEYTGPPVREQVIRNTTDIP